MTHRHDWHGWRMGFVICGALCLAAAGAARADENSPFIGHWRWDRALSKLPPGEPAPTDMSLDFERVDAVHVRWTVTVKDAQGRPSLESHDTPGNGEFYPISEDTTASFRMLAPDRLQASFKGPEGETDSMTCTVAPDRRKMTCEGTKSAGGGKAVSYVDVYDRE